MNIFEVDISYLSIPNEETFSFQSFEIFFIGLTHAFFSALPVSPPLFICLRRLLIQGVPAGIASYLATAIGETFFLFFILFGFRDLIQFWYDWEPILYFLGIALTCSILFEFSQDYRLQKISIDQTQTLIQIFGIHFVLMFLNPVVAFNSTQFPLSIETTRTWFPMATTAYLSGFFIGLFGFSCLFGFVFLFLKNWFQAISLKPYGTFMRPLNRWLIILGLSLIFNVTGKYTWHLFIQYPAETFASSLERLNLFSNENTSSPSIVRHFHGFDSSIRNRERNLPVSRYFPVETFKQRRIWNDKPPLTEAQTQDAYFRYNIHYINKFSKFINEKRQNLRTPFSLKKSLEQINRLKQVKQDYFTLLKAQPILNKGKGNPTFSYTQEQIASNAKNMYIHDDFYVLKK